MRAEIHSEHAVPRLGGGPVELAARPDAHIEHHTVDPAQRIGGLVYKPVTLTGLCDVGDHRGSGAALGLDELNGLLRGLRDHVHHRYRRSLPSREDRDCLPVAGRRLGIADALAAGAHHEDAASCEAGSSPRGTPRCRRKALVVAHDTQTVGSAAWR